METRQGLILKRYVLRPDSRLARLLRKKHLFRPFFIITLLLLLFLLLSQLILGAIGYFFPQARVVDWGTVELGQWVKVLAIREEHLLTAPFPAELHLLAEEGTRIRVGETLAELIRADLNPGLDQEQRLTLRALAGRLNQIEQETAQLEKDLAFLLSQKQSPPATQEQIKQLRTALSLLQDTRTHLLANLENNFPAWTEYYRLVVADRPGFFSTRLDGGEELDVFVASEMSGDPFTQSYRPTQNVPKKVQQGKAWGKIIADYAQTLICRLPAEANLEPPEEAILVVNGERFPLAFLATDYTNRHWFFTEKTLAPTLLEQRLFPGYLIFKRTTGLRVPAAALNYHEQAGWTVTTSIKGSRSKLGVEVIAQNDQWAIVEGLPIGTMVFYR